MITIVAGHWVSLPDPYTLTVRGVPTVRFVEDSSRLVILVWATLMSRLAFATVGGAVGEVRVWVAGGSSLPGGVLPVAAAAISGKASAKMLMDMRFLFTICFLWFLFQMDRSQVRQCLEKYPSYFLLNGKSFWTSIRAQTARVVVGVVRRNQHRVSTRCGIDVLLVRAGLNRACCGFLAGAITKMQRV